MIQSGSREKERERENKRGIKERKKERERERERAKARAVLHICLPHRLVEANETESLLQQATGSPLERPIRPASVRIITVNSPSPLTNDPKWAGHQRGRGGACVIQAMDVAGHMPGLGVFSEEAWSNWMGKEYTGRHTTRNSKSIFRNNGRPS